MTIFLLTVRHLWSFNRERFGGGRTDYYSCAVRVLRAGRARTTSKTIELVRQGLNPICRSWAFAYNV